MKILSKLLLFAITFFVIILGIFYNLNNGNLNKQLQHSIQYYLMFKDINANILDCKFKDGLLTASKITFKIGKSFGIIKDLKIQTNISGNWYNPAFKLDISPLEIVIFSSNNDKIAELSFSGQLVRNIIRNKNYELALNNIILPNLKDINGKDLGSAEAIFKYNEKGKNQNIYASLKFGEVVYLNINNAETNSAKIKIEMHDIPLAFYKIANEILPENKLLIFLNDFIYGGYIKNATILWTPDEIFSKETCYGRAKIQELDINYADAMPRAKNMDIDVGFQGNLVKFHINKAYVSDVLLEGGLIEMNWKGIDDTILTIDAKGSGSAKSLTDFISENQHALMSKANIDLRKIKGTADVNIDIKIPLKPGTQNIYNISANLPNSSLDIFNNNIKLKEAAISGVFNGKQIILNGSGKINEFLSNIDFIYNIEDESEFNHKLDIKTHFKTKGQKQDKAKIGFVTLLGGESPMHLEYKNKNSQGFISINSDISGLDLYFDKLGIRKQENQKARFLVNGIFNDPKSGSFDFSVTGENKLAINGNVSINNGKFLSKIKQIKSKQTNLSAELLMEGDFISIDLKGDTLDLSEANMFQFLEKERDGGSMRLRFNVEKVRLKNDIWLDNLRMMFECNKNRCHSGFLESKLGSRPLEVLLSAEGDGEKWLITCGNAGALLKGLGTYDSMKSGNLILNINTSRKEVQPGEIIPILNGNFTFERFVLSNTPTLSRLVSFVSLPGFISAISGNKDIRFSVMDGKFSFANNVLNVQNSMATGLYFDFTLKGDIDVQNRMLNIKGHVVPKLYGISSVIGTIPIIGNIFTGSKKNNGLISASYKIKEKY